MKQVDSKGNQPQEKSRDQVLAEREAKKLAKQNAKKKKGPNANQTAFQPSSSATVDSSAVKSNDGEKKPREDSSTETNVKKSKQIKNAPKSSDHGSSNPVKVEEAEKAAENKSKAQLRAERRALQEAQRAKKTDVKNETKAAVENNKITKTTEVKTTKKNDKESSRHKVIKPSATQDGVRRVKLFAHLYAKMDLSPSVLTGVENVHSSIARLGAQYRARSICGSNARVQALLDALTELISDFKTPPKEEFSRGLEAELTRSLAFLQRCRPVSVSMSNAMRQLRQQVSQSKLSEAEAKAELIDWIDTYNKDQLEKAAEAISIFVRGKISDGDVILTYSCSSLIQKILITAARQGVKFRVIVVDGRPWLEGREMLRRLLLAGIQCTYVLVNAVSFVMSEVTKILLGAHALLANGYVMSRTGSSQIALLGRALNVPVLVCCETHKFSEKVQTDSFVHNELGDPNDLLQNAQSIGSLTQTPSSLTPLNLAYDVTPPDLVSAVVTELAVLPCTSVPVILRIK